MAGINEHINNPDGGYRVETIINVDTANNSPLSAVPPIVRCPMDALCTFKIPESDPDGDIVSFRLSSSAEAATFTGFVQPGPPDAPNAATIDNATGLYTWDTTGATLAADPFNNTLYSTQVTIEDDTSKVAVDFLIELVEEDVNPPLIEPPVGSPPICETTQVATVGNTKTFDVMAFDPDAPDIVTLNVAALPVGAIMTPALPVAANPVLSTFSWSPDSDDVGTHVATFTASSSGGGFALCSVTIEVVQEAAAFVEGTVFVSSGNVMFGALVTAEPGGFATATEGDGRYLVSLPTGTYSITASADGYISDSVPNVSVVGNETTIVDLHLGSPLVAGAGVAGQGLLRFIREVLEVTIGVILDILQKGAGTLWQGILAAFDIKRAAEIGTDFQDPAYWARAIDQAYALNKDYAVFAIDDCVGGIVGGGTIWKDLSDQQKRDEELQQCIFAMLGGGYTSGTINPAFMKRWLQ